MKGNGYSNDEKTPEGRLDQLRSWCAAAFAVETFTERFLETKRDDLGGKTPAEKAKESLEGLEQARAALKAYRQELK